MKLNWLVAFGGVALTACASDDHKVTDKPLNIVLINLLHMHRSGQRTITISSIKESMMIVQIL